MSYYITTDSCSDVSKHFIEKFGSKNFAIAPITYVVNGQLYDIENTKLDEKTFYNMMRDNATISTSLINTFSAEIFFKGILEQGFDIIHLSFSSGISGTFESVTVAANNLKKEFPDRKIVVIDSKLASLGLGLLFYYTLKKRDSGASFEQCAEYATNLSSKINAIFIVDDLKHLQKTGRVSKAEAFIGTALQIKPILHMDDAGKLIPVFKTVSKKKALKLLAEKTNEKISIKENEMIFISHGDSEEDAKYLSNYINDTLKLDCFIDYISPTIGAHSGPGTIAIFFIAQSRAL